jgi:hypothetical protein
VKYEGRGANFVEVRVLSVEVAAEFDVKIQARFQDYYDSAKRFWSGFFAALWA